MCADPNDFNLIMKKYERLKLHEQQFNEQLIETRKFASAWLLATLGGIAYLVSQDLSGRSIDLSIPLLSITGNRLSSLTALLGIIGLLTLWILEHKVYQRLLDSVISLAQTMESEHKELPQIRNKMKEDSGDLNFFIALFYIIPMATLAVMAICFDFLVGIGSAIIVVFVVLTTHRRHIINKMKDTSRELSQLWKS